MPMVWYIPPLSPVVDVVRDTGEDAEDRGPLRCHRHPSHPGGVPRQPVHRRRHRTRRPRPEEARRDAVLHARHHPRPRPRRLDPRGGRDDGRADVRHVPTARDREVRRALRHPVGARRAGPRPRGARDRLPVSRLRRRPAGPFGEGSGYPTTVASRTSGCCRTARPRALASPDDKASRVNLLNWDGKGTPKGLFPRSATTEPLDEPLRAPPGPARPAGGAHVGGLLGCCWTTPPSSCSPRSTTSRPWLPGHPPSRRSSTTCGARRLAQLAAGLRRHLRPHPEVRALPDLLRLRGHPSSEERRASLQETYRPLGVAWDHDVGGSPTTCARCSQFGATVDPDIARSPSSSTAPAWRCCASRSPGGATRRRDRVAVGRRAVALCDTLPEPPGREADAVRRLVEQGPPAEEVGLAGYAADPALPSGPALDLVRHGPRRSPR